MIEELDFETYLNISNNSLRIYVLNKKNMSNLYYKEFNFINDEKDLDMDIVSKFLENNIFEIEKLIGNFIKNINLIIENKKIFSLNLGIKKKNYETKIDKKILEITLTEAKDLLKENYQEYRVMHMIVNNFIINGSNYPKLIDNLECDNLCLDLKFILVPNKLAFEIEKVLENYQIKITRYLNERYLKNFFRESGLELPQMAYKIHTGHNENEVTLAQKNTKKLGFFERFFQLFS